MDIIAKLALSINSISFGANLSTALAGRGSAGTAFFIVVSALIIAFYLLRREQCVAGRAKR